MWEALDRTGRQVLFEARAAASNAGSELINEVHLLEGVRQTAQSLPVHRPASQPVELLAEAVGALGTTAWRPSTTGREHVVREIPFSESSKRLLQSATEIAESLGHRHVHWGHILLALAEDESAAVRDTLAAACLTSESIRERLGSEPW